MRFPAPVTLLGVTLILGAPMSAGRAQNRNPVVTPAAETKAQAAASTYASRQVSNAELADALRRSGLTQEAVRARLQAAGYDPALADPFYAVTPGVTSPATPITADLVTPLALGGQSSLALAAFQAVGILSTVQTSSGSTATSDATTSDGMLAPSPARRVASAGSSAVFGKDIFSGASTAFDPVVSGPVDPSYRLGIGDHLQCILTGDVEAAYQLEIRRDGSVFLPQLGQITIAGLTMDAARTVLRRRAGAAYSGIHTGTTRLDLSLHRIRSNAIFVIGEVEQPGAMQVNALATAFHAIAKAGGPTARGSFRNVEVRRAGQVIGRLDLYRYLLDGDASNDVRTEHGDVVYVPLSSRTINLTGAVRRPGTFELLPDEGFQALLRFAGGVQSTASLERVQIDRVLPPEQRKPGVERVLIDVQIGGSLDSLHFTPLHDGDAVTVFFVGDVRRNAVLLRGEVLQPGSYEFEPGLTLQSLIAKAQGLLPWALADRIKVIRVIPASGLREEMSFDYRSTEARDFPLREFDNIIVLDGRRPAGSLGVDGAVWKPGTLGHAEGQTLADAIDAAGGLKPEAVAILISRKRIGRQHSDTTSHVLRVEVDSDKLWEAAASRFLMEYDDNVYVLSSPGVRPQRFVVAAGLFAYPGTYAINQGVDRVADVLRRAGSPLPNAFHENFQLLRNELPIAIDLGRALGGDPHHNVLLHDGDRLSIGPNPNTVLVTGEVGRNVLVLYRRGLSLRDYVELAGGPKVTADLSRATVEDLSGKVSRARRHLILFRSNPSITPGAKITVPAKPESTTSVQQVLNTTLQYASVIASLAVAYVAVIK